MLSFIGEYYCKSDSKARVVVPSAFRRELQKEGQTVFVLRKNIYEKCLDAFPYGEWEKMVVQLKSRLNLFDRRHASFFRAFYAGIQEVEMDANGRILLPKRMLEEIGVDKEMVFSGQDAKIEIWNASDYDGIKISPDEFAGMTEEVLK